MISNPGTGLPFLNSESLKKFGPWSYNSKNRMWFLRKTFVHNIIWYYDNMMIAKLIIIAITKALVIINRNNVMNNKHSDDYDDDDD